MEFDLARFRRVTDSAAFVSTLKSTCNATLTNDFWTITLPSELAASAALSPSMFAFFAALNLHDARVLFSDQEVLDLIQKRAAHHAEHEETRRKAEK